jgi:thiamine biosynthesis lipoprotein
MQRFQEQLYILGSDCLITLVAASKTQADPIFTDIWQHIHDYDDRFSRFKSGSELSRLNRSAGQPTEVSPQMYRNIERAVELAIKTDGLFNPLVLPAVQSAGYAGSWPEVAKVEPGLDMRGRSLAKATDIVLADDHITLPANSALDSGGFGKGMLLDELTELIGDQVLGYCCSLGGDIVCAGYDLDNQLWSIGIEDVARHGQQVRSIFNKGGSRLAVATSGTTMRRGVSGGRAWHHIIDPRTGEPAKTDLLAATVATSSAVEADVYAKCVVILGSRQAPEFLQRMGITEFVLQPQTVNDKGQGNMLS